MVWGTILVAEFSIRIDCMKLFFNSVQAIFTGNIKVKDTSCLETGSRWLILNIEGVECRMIFNRSPPVGGWLHSVCHSQSQDNYNWISPPSYQPPRRPVSGSRTRQEIQLNILTVISTVGLSGWPLSNYIYIPSRQHNTADTLHTHQNISSSQEW